MCVCVRVHFKFKRKAGSSAEVYWLDFEEYVSIIQEASEGIGSWISRIIVILVIFFFLWGGPPLVNFGSE